MDIFLQRNAIALITATKMMFAAIIAFFIITYLTLPLGVWAIVTIAAITQVGLAQTLSKSLMRVIGTLVGAVIGYAIAVLAQGHIPLMMILVLSAIWLSSYIALQPTIYSYASIVAGMTIAIIIFYCVDNLDFFAVTVDRSVEILLGVFVLSFLNICLFFLVKKYYPQGIVAEKIAWQRPVLQLKMEYAIPATKVAIACFLTFFICYWFKLPQGYWATITCLLIMEENNRGTIKKGFFRFISHFVAALLSFVCVALIVNFSYAWRLLPLAGVFFGCGFLIGRKNQYASMGNTIGIAISIMLLTDPAGQATISIIFERFYNVVIGIGIAFVMLSLNVRFKQTSIQV